jgi:hypothetical protein
MLARLSARLSPDQAHYLHDVLGAAFSAVALVALLLVLLFRGPSGAARTVLP